MKTSNFSPCVNEHGVPVGKCKEQAVPLSNIENCQFEVFPRELRGKWKCRDQRRRDKKSSRRGPSPPAAEARANHDRECHRECGKKSNQGDWRTRNSVTRAMPVGEPSHRSVEHRQNQTQDFCEECCQRVGNERSRKHEEPNWDC